MPTDSSTSSSRTAKLAAASAIEAARERECPFRERHQCLYLNGLLGWPHGYALPNCDTCWSKGAAFTEEGSAHLLAEAVSIITDLSKLDRVGKLTRGVLVPLTIKHRVIPLETFRVEAARIARAKEIAPIWQRAFSFLKALTSKVSSTLSREDHALRHISCFGTTPDGARVSDPCPSLKEHEGHFYCGACGCGHPPWAAVDTVKLTFPELKCPRDRPGFSP